MYVGKGNVAGATLALGTLNQTAGAVTSTGGLRIGTFGTGVYNQSGGTTAVTGTGGFTSLAAQPGSVGTYNLTGTATFTNAATAVDVNVGDRGTGVLNLADAAVFNASAGNFFIARQPTATGTVNLNGGSLIIPAVGTNNGGTAAFNFNGGTLVASANATAFLAGAGTVSVGAGGANLDTGAFNVSVGKPLLAAAGSTGGLTKLGTGTLTLTGASTYAGPTALTAGDLRVNNTAGSGTGFGAVTIAPGTTLGGSGTINNSAGAVAVNGTITAGNSSTAVGTLTTAAQQWNAGGTFLAKFAAGNAANDQLVLSGLTVSGPFTVDVTGPDILAAGGSYVLATDLAPTSADPFVLGSLTLQVNESTPPALFTLQEQPGTAAGSYDLLLVAAPEPTSLLLLGIAAAPLALGRRRRSAATAA